MQASTSPASGLAGGNASSNIGVDYTKRISPAALARFEAFGFAPGLLKASR